MTGALLEEKFEGSDALWSIFWRSLPGDGDLELPVPDKGAIWGGTADATLLEVETSFDVLGESIEERLCKDFA